jgi:hypothetical protein
MEQGAINREGAAMPVKVRCQCGKQLLVKDEAVGKRIKCPACKETLQVPQQSPPVAAPAPVESPPVDELETDPPFSEKSSPPRRLLWPWIAAGVGMLCLVGVAVFFFLTQGAQDEDTHLRFTYSDENGYRSSRNRESAAKSLGMSEEQLRAWANDPAAAAEKRMVGPVLQAGGTSATLFGQGFNETLWRDPSGNEMYTMRNQFLTLTSRSRDSVLKIMTINGSSKPPTVEQVRAWAEDESAASERRSAIMIRAGHTESISRGVLVKPPG